MTEGTSREDGFVDVLVVDDDPDVLSAHRRILEQAGLTVIVADDGLSAYAEIKANTFRAIVCDIRMPFLGGKSLFEQLEEAYPTAAGRVIFVSGILSEAGTREFLEHTGQPFLAKPADVAELVELVRQMIKKQIFQRPR